MFTSKTGTLRVMVDGNDLKLSGTVGRYSRPAALRYVELNLNLIGFFKKGVLVQSQRDRSVLLYTIYGTYL